MIGWAYKITGRDREQAEDLVHDLFVLFMASRPDLDSLDNADGYLYTSLRNLHLSNARRAARRQEVVVAYGDFDVLEHGSLRTSLRALHGQADGTYTGIALLAARELSRPAISPARRSRRFSHAAEPLAEG